MKRRKLLKSLGLGLSAGLIMPELLISCKKDDPGPEIIFNGTVAVIGAGPAGLYVADRLRAKGLSVIILEASDQIGGRVKSYRAPKPTIEPIPDGPFQYITDNPSTADFPLELGPESFIGSDSIWGKIVNDLGIATFDNTGSADKYILDGIAQNASDLSADVDFLAVQGFVAGLPNQTGSGASMKAASGVSARGDALLNSQAGNRYGSSSNNIDAGAVGADLTLAAAKHDSKMISLKASLMQDVLKSRFTQVAGLIRYNTVVKSINYSGEKIIITDKDGVETSVEKVVVTVPLPILKTLTFTPSLPGANTAAMSKFGMDNAIRIILDFKKNFWGDATTGFIWGGTASPQYWNAGTGRSEDYRTLTLTITGPKAAELSALGTGMITPILDELDAIYDGQATINIRRKTEENPEDEVIKLFTSQDWSKEEFIKGGFSYPLVGATNDDREALSKPVNDRVFFAGEATAFNGDAGTINGALASAERAAVEVEISITG